MDFQDCDGTQVYSELPEGLLVFSVRVTDAAGNSAVADHSFGVRNSTGGVVESPATLPPPPPPGTPDSVGQVAPREKGWAGTGVSTEGVVLLVMGLTFFSVTGCLVWYLCVCRRDWLMGLTGSAPPSPEIRHVAPQSRSLDVEAVVPFVGPVQVRTWCNTAVVCIGNGCAFDLKLTRADVAVGYGCSAPSAD